MNGPFAPLAEEFIAEVQSHTLTSTTEVNVVYHCVDEFGRMLTPFRMSMVAMTKVTAPGDPEFAREFALVMHRDSIIQNINSLVRPALPDRFCVPREYATTIMRLVRLELEILDPIKE
jgi:hypothetical protein